jgi:DTW domain-containing protein YfiP
MSTAISASKSKSISSPSSDLDLDLDRDLPVDNLDLTPDQLSSNERYAEILNMTIHDVEKQKHKRQKASEDLHLTLQSTLLNLSGKEKHELICQHLLDNGRHPFECPKCWTYKPICVCDLAKNVTKNSKEEVKGTIADTIADTTTTSSSSSTSTSTTTSTTANTNTNNNDNDNNINNDVDVIVWTHHREWGIISNTGIILSLTLPNLNDNIQSCQLLMKGLPQHDQILHDIIVQSEQSDDDDPDDLNNNPSPPPLVVVLWPEVSKIKKESKKKNKNKNKKCDNDDDDHDHDSVQEQQHPSQSQSSQSQPTYTSIDEIKKEMAKNKQQRKKIVLIAVDGTWRNARRMVSRLPLTIPRLDLSIDTVFGGSSNSSSSDDDNDDDAQFTSILAPLRSRGDDERNNNNNNNNGSTTSSSSRRQVCTAEAVVGALMSLGTINEHQGQHVLDVTKTKIERVCKYRGKDYNI